MHTTSVIVIGAGLAGAAAAWRLAEAGHEVTLLERTTPGNEEGSSHGSARIFRYAYPDQRYVDLVARSEAGWSELAARSGVELITRTGCLDFGERRDPRRLASVLAAAGVEHALLSADEARARWPIAVDGEALWQPSAGVIDAISTVQAMVDAAVAAGAELHEHAPVAAIGQSGSGYTVRLADDAADPGAVFGAEQVVIAAGGWLPELVGGLPLPSSFLGSLPTFEVWQENAFHFPYRDETAWPTFIYKHDETQVYSLPGGRDAEFRGQKLAHFQGGTRIPSAAAQTGVVDADARARAVGFVRDMLPGLEPEPYAETTCLFTMTPNEDFLIDRCDGITILSACSGHGAKFAPVLGDLAVDLVEGRRAPAQFSAAAFAGA